VVRNATLPPHRPYIAVMGLHFVNGPWRDGDADYGYVARTPGTISLLYRRARTRSAGCQKAEGVGRPDRLCTEGRAAGVDPLMGHHPDVSVTVLFAGRRWIQALVL